MIAAVGARLTAPLRHMRGVFLRHFYLWARNPEYMFETLWQPVVEVLIWGFVSHYLSRLQAELGALVAYFLGAIFLWAVLRRGQHEITFSIMEEAWSRNLQNLLITPVSMVQYYAATVTFSLIKLAVELTLMAALVGGFFGFNVLTIGMALVPFMLSLFIMGWALGLVVNAIIIYFGRGLVPLSWIISFVIQPFSCVFYPLEALPAWAQPVAHAVPATWVFEGMRAVLSGAGLNPLYLAWAFGLNAIYLAAGYFVFARVMKLARERGFLLRLEW